MSIKAIMDPSDLLNRVHLEDDEGQTIWKMGLVEAYELRVQLDAILNDCTLTSPTREQYVEMMARPCPWPGILAEDIQKRIAELKAKEQPKEEKDDRTIT